MISSSRANSVLSVILLKLLFLLVVKMVVLGIPCCVSEALKLPYGYKNIL